MPFKILHTNISNQTVMACNLIQIKVILVFKYSLMKGHNRGTRLQWKLMHFFAKYQDI